jgi:hypothetical protein
MYFCTCPTSPPNKPPTLPPVAAPALPEPQ